MPVDIVQESSSTFRVMAGEVVVSENHRELHVALESAINYSENCACNPIIERVQRYRVEYTKPALGLPETKIVNLSWTPPSYREDGSSLLEEEIIGYVVMFVSIDKEIVVKEQVIEIESTSIVSVETFYEATHVAVATKDSKGTTGKFSMFSRIN